MKKIQIGKSDIQASEIALGCMRIKALSQSDAEKLVLNSFDMGINFFDHADIYGGGECESIFGNILENNKGFRDKIYIQTKCGIVNGTFNFTYDHIVTSVEKSLKRLKTDYVDVLLLHRPDTLFVPEEVGKAFDKLFKDGKVKNFGVSNQNMMQMELLQSGLNVPIIADQLQFSVTHTGMIDNGFNVNMKVDNGIDRDGSVLEYCRLKKITIQAWSPMQYGFFKGAFIDESEKYTDLNNTLQKYADKYNASKEAISIAWILAHPAKIQPIIGTTKFERVEKIVKASDINLLHDEWYDIYKSAGNRLP